MVNGWTRWIGLRGALLSVGLGAALMSLSCAPHADSNPLSGESLTLDDSAAMSALTDETRLARIFVSTCAHCHLGPPRGVPRVGVPAEWNERETQDFDELVRHTIDGFRNMPPLGTCSYCTESDLRSLIALMVAGSEVGVPAATVGERTR